MNSSVSKELVPMAPYRDAWNTLHGTSLTAHNSLLTAEQSAQINAQYDIEVAFGTHALRESLRRCTELEYDEVASLVAHLEPGIDTLLIEGYGFTEQPEEPEALIDTEALSAKVDPSARYSFQLFREMYEDSTRSMTSELERQRGLKELSAWDYARQLAHIKGVRVVNADYDAFEMTTTLALSGHQSLRELQADPSERAQGIYKEIIIRQRGLKAVNTVKDYALAHPVVTPTSGRKPKLILLIGRGHDVDVTAAFNAMHLDIETTQLRRSSDRERMLEEFSRRPMLPMVFPLVLRAAATQRLLSFPGPTTSAFQELGRVQRQQPRLPVNDRTSRQFIVRRRFGNRPPQQDSSEEE